MRGEVRWVPSDSPTPSPTMPPCARPPPPPGLQPCAYAAERGRSPKEVTVHGLLQRGAYAALRSGAEPDRARRDAIGGRLEQQLWWCWAPPSTPRGSGYGAGSSLGQSFNPTFHPPSVCGRALSRAASAESPPAALTPSAAGPRPAPAHPGSLAKRNPIRIGGAPPSASIPPSFYLGPS